MGREDQEHCLQHLSCLNAQNCLQCTQDTH